MDSSAEQKSDGKDTAAKPAPKPFSDQIPEKEKEKERGGPSHRQIFRTFAMGLAHRLNTQQAARIRLIVSN